MAVTISTIGVHDISCNEGTVEETKMTNSLVAERANNKSMKLVSSMNINSTLFNEDIPEKREKDINNHAARDEIEIFEDSISVVSISNTSDDAEKESQRKTKIDKKGQKKTEDLDTDRGTQEFHSVDEKMEYEPDNLTTLKVAGKCLAYSGAIIATCALFVVPWTSIPRTDTIVYQSQWWETFLPSATIYILSAAVEVLNLTVWTQERSLATFHVFLMIYLLWLTPFFIILLMNYFVWSVYLGLNQPLPNLGLWTILSSFFILYPIGIWFVLPSQIVSEHEFRRKLRWYLVQHAFRILTIILNEVMSMLFINLPAHLQFLISFMMVACREFDLRVRSKLVDKMMGNQDEAATALLEILVNATYSFFIANKFPDAEISTIIFVIAIEFSLRLRLTYQVIKEQRKVIAQNVGNRDTNKNIIVMNLVISELMEGFVPIIYGSSIFMAYYGPNSNLFANIGSNYWGYKIEDISLVGSSMLLLFAVDIVSTIATSFWLWKETKTNMLPEFYKVLEKYWLFMILILATFATNYFASTDINLGGDFTGSFRWIENEGWRGLVNESEYLTDEERFMLLNMTAWA